jgi:hypothetical protein
MNHFTKQLLIIKAFYALLQLATQPILVQAHATYNTRHHLATNTHPHLPLTKRRHNTGKGSRPKGK